MAFDDCTSNAVTGGWRWPSLFGSLLVAWALAASWLRPETRPVWDWLDVSAFRALNNTLALGTWWQHVWALGNWRGFDAVSGGLMLIVTVCALRSRPAWNRAHCLYSFLTFILVVVLTRELVSEWILDKQLRFHRPSPTLTLDNCHRLSLLAPKFEPKDESPWSFPGDHGFVLFSVAAYVGYVSNRNIWKWGWFLAVLLSVPRLIAGAHWITDLAVGSLSMALVAVALLMATPLHDAIVFGIDGLISGRQRLRRPAVEA